MHCESVKLYTSVLNNSSEGKFFCIAFFSYTLLAYSNQILMISIICAPFSLKSARIGVKHRTAPVKIEHVFLLSNNTNVKISIEFYHNIYHIVHRHNTFNFFPKKGLVCTSSLNSFLQSAVVPL